MKISVITPTFNRGKLLERCYRSLCSQQMKEFEWLVIDDGSTDNSGEIIESFIKENKITIQYVYKDNGGKHTAHNVGVQKSSGDLIVCLDSDDFLPEHALERAWKMWLDKKQENTIGIIAKRGTIDGGQLCSDFPANIDCLTMFDLTNKYHFSGDTILFFRSDIIKKCNFPTFGKEKFLPETALYYQLDEYGKMIIADEVLYIGEYQPDGLTSKYHRLLSNNPIGAAYTYNLAFTKAISIKDKLKYAVLTMAYWGHENKKYYRVNNWFYMLYPVGKIYKKARLDRL